MLFLSTISLALFAQSIHAIPTATTTVADAAFTLAAVDKDGATPLSQGIRRSSDSSIQSGSRDSIGNLFHQGSMADGTDGAATRQRTVEFLQEMLRLSLEELEEYL